MNKKRLLVSILLLGTIVLLLLFNKNSAELFKRNFGLGEIQYIIFVLSKDVIYALVMIFVSITVLCKVKFDNINKVYIRASICYIVIFFILLISGMIFAPKMFMILKYLSFLLTIPSVIIGIYLNEILD